MSEPSEGVGSLAEETAKLLGALSGLAREHATEHGPEHATASQDCVYCPVCRAIHLVRQTSPDVREHLASAAASLVQAAAGLLATTAFEDRRTAGGVEHIDLDGDVPVEDLIDPEGTP